MRPLARAVSCNRKINNEQLDRHYRDGIYVTIFWTTSDDCDGQVDFKVTLIRSDKRTDK